MVMIASLRSGTVPLSCILAGSTVYAGTTFQLYLEAELNRGKLAPCDHHASLYIVYSLLLHAIFFYASHRLLPGYKLRATSHARLHYFFIVLVWGLSCVLEKNRVCSYIRLSRVYPEIPVCRFGEGEGNVNEGGLGCGIIKQQ